MGKIVAETICMIFSFIHPILLGALILFLSVCEGQCIAAAAPINLALGRPATFTPIAKYHLTHSDHDAEKLTDGRYASGHFWKSPETVGWQESGPIRIQIPLGRTANIEKVCLRTARGNHAGVSYPERVDMFVASNRNPGQFGYLGDLLAFSKIEEGGYQVSRFCSDALGASGDSLLLVVKPHGIFTFIDEVEILGHLPGAESTTVKARSIQSRDMDAFLASRYRMGEEWKASQTLALELREYSLPLASKGIKDWGLRPDEAAGSNGQDSEALRVKIFSARRSMLSEKYLDPLLIWQSNPWEAFSPVAPPVGPIGAGQQIHLDLPKGGTTSSALSLLNTTDQPMSVSVQFQPDEPDGGGLLVQLRQVLPVVRKDYRSIGDALPSLDGGAMTLQPGESRQLWLTVQGATTPPGTYSGHIAMNGVFGDRLIPLVARVWPAALPAVPTLAVNNWAYLNHWRPLRGIPELAVADLKSHHVNVVVVHPEDVPWPKALPGRTYPGLADFHRFDPLVRLHGKDSTYLLYLGFNERAKAGKISSYPLLSEPWSKDFKAWLTSLRNHLAELGLSPGNCLIYPIDEPRTEDDFTTIAKISRLTREMDPPFQLYSTVSVLPELKPEMFLSYLDVAQVLESLLSEVTRLPGKGPLQLWTYTAEGGGKHAHPHEFYRLQAWRAYRAGATGIGFWAYADTGPSGTAWNDFDGTRPDYAVVYEGEKEIISSKRWEAWREGVEDYEILRLAKAQLRGAAEEAQFRLWIDRVIAHPQDYTLFQEMRRRLLEIASRE